MKLRLEPWQQYREAGVKPVQRFNAQTFNDRFNDTMEAILKEFENRPNSIEQPSKDKKVTLVSKNIESWTL